MPPEMFKLLILSLDKDKHPRQTKGTFTGEKNKFLKQIGIFGELPYGRMSDFQFHSEQR